MRQWIKNYESATNQTKIFVWMAIIFGVALVYSTVYSYARLDYVRSYKVTKETHDKVA